MNVSQSESPSKSYSGSRYFREFVSKIRKDPDAGKYEHLEDYPHDILSDDELGLRLYHAGINPYDQDHFRHQIYIVVADSPQGKASKICRINTVVAASLTLQWTKRGDLCNALLLSIKGFGQCTFAWCGESPNQSKCGWCGHGQRTLLWRSNQWKWLPYRRGRALRQGERHCCRWNKLARRYECCRCKDPDNALMGPLDREDAASMPQSVLPATIEGHKLYMSNSVAVGNGAAQPTVNNFHFYGNIYQAATGGSSDGPMIGPSSYVFSAMPLAITSLPRAMIDFTSSVTSSMPQTGLEPGRVVGEVNDEQGGSGSGPSKIRNYTRPMVEEDVDDGGISKSGLAEKFFRVDVNKAST
ncbi:hypothetical protein MCOR02_000993 [Pyricularia oryzae]|nr:hypothetical protein MCOR02_000993 [Pyricularia oryzae]KAI6327153.1 hypothetical protein MCOR34_000583 [Pyricularia oryzae]KAI6330715.1 hypothetical protein MCOR30_005039 [Pyricularia oryzae]KAI6367497.1 hypothetical protein MCOR32_007141 [Pyricularia oryzae]KAI6391061.1 hypothetical protein MCOR23_009188 [Pyricularia oryzae]